MCVGMLEQLCEELMYKYSLATAFILSSVSVAISGGFELQTLDTSAMYESGGYASLSTANLNSKLNGVGADGKKVKTLKDQSFSNFSVKGDIAGASIGLVTYRSGAIQMSGDSDATFAGSYAPSVNANIDTIALLAKYKVDESFDLIGGIKQNNLSAFNLTSIYGSYDINSKSNNSYVLGGAYSIPEIALRAELLVQPASKMSTAGSFAGSALVGNAPGTVSANIKQPEMVTLNFQTGIAANTLLRASVHQAKWGSAQVNADVTTGSAGVDAAAAVASEFGDSTKYTIGVGRKFSKNLSGSISYNQEAGGGATSTSSFTMSNGSKAVSAGMQYSLENMNISLGVSHTMFNDVTVQPTTPGVPALSYTGNSATTFGVKVAFAF